MCEEIKEEIRLAVKECELAKEYVISDEAKDKVKRCINDYLALLDEYNKNKIEIYLLKYLVIRTQPKLTKEQLIIYRAINGKYYEYVNNLKEGIDKNKHDNLNLEYKKLEGDQESFVYYLRQRSGISLESSKILSDQIASILYQEIFRVQNNKNQEK